MNFLRWLFGKGTGLSSHYELTQEFYAWEDNILITQAEMKRMGNRPDVESREKLLIRYHKLTNLSPFVVDVKNKNLAAIKDFYSANGIL